MALSADAFCETLMQLSIIVPIAAGDLSWINLYNDLIALEKKRLLTDCELLFSGTDEAINACLASMAEPTEPLSKCNVRGIKTDCGRAQAMNAAAAVANGHNLWFVHADSRLQAQHIKALGISIARCPEALHYFNLSFDGAKLMQINAAGVWLRSHVLKNPFGDQAFCINTALFHRIGGYLETLPYGEDHRFVWQALQHGTRIRCTGATLQTSARKYQTLGWLLVTSKHIALWFVQAAPQFIKLCQIRLQRITGFKSTKPK